MKIKQWVHAQLATIVVQHLFNWVTERDLLMVNTEGVWYQGKRLPDDLVHTLKRDAQVLMKSDLWIILTNAGKYAANQKMFTKSNDVLDMIGGKAMLKSMEVLEATLAAIRNLP